MESSIERANEIQSYQNSSMKMYTDFLKYNHDVVSVVVIVHISKKVVHLRKKAFLLQNPRTKHKNCINRARAEQKQNSSTPDINQLNKNIQ